MGGCLWTRLIMDFFRRVALGLMSLDLASYGLFRWGVVSLQVPGIN